MSKLKKVCTCIFGLFAIACSAIIFSGCKDDVDYENLFVFAGKGGYVQINNSDEFVRYGDEGKMLTFEEGSEVKLKAIPELGYKFDKWEYTEDKDERFEDLSRQAEITITMDDDIVIRPLFVSTGESLQYVVTYPTNAIGYSIVPLSSSNVVNAGENFEFRVSLNEGYNNSNIVVKANNKILTATNSIYTIINITEDINITVSNIVLNSYTVTLPTIDGLTFEIVDGSTVVEKGGNFKFKINADSRIDTSEMVVAYTGDSFINKQVTRVVDVYVITNINSNILISVSGLKEATVKRTVTLQDGTNYTFVKTDGSHFSSKSIEVNHGEIFNFKVETLKELAIVKQDGKIISPVTSIYSIEVTSDVIITVEVYNMITLPISDAYTIVDIDGNEYEHFEFVKDGEEFKFKVNLTDSENTDVEVMLMGQKINPENEIYTITTVNNATITINVVQKIETVTYNFTFELEEEDRELISGLITSIPESMNFTIIKSNNEQDEYVASEFMIMTSNDEEISISELVNNINMDLMNSGLQMIYIDGVKSFNIAGQKFIELDIFNDIITVNWNVLTGTNTDYVLTIVL